MNFSSNRFQKLSGLLTESVEDKKDEEVSENEVIEAMAAEMEKEGDELKEFEFLQAAGVAAQLASAVQQAIKKDPNLQKDIIAVLESSPKTKGLVGTFKKFFSSDEKAGDVKETRLRQFIRGEIDSAWATGEVFGRKAPRTKGVTMGFAGIGFKK